MVPRKIGSDTGLMMVGRDRSSWKWNVKGSLENSMISEYAGRGGEGNALVNASVGACPQDLYTR